VSRSKGELISQKGGRRSTSLIPTASLAPAFRCKISLDKPKQPPYTPPVEKQYLINFLSIISIKKGLLIEMEIVEIPEEVEK
jgi:hypothetical protein